MQKRLEVLLKWLEYSLNYDIQKLDAVVNVKYLFYNDYDESKIHFEKINL